LPYTISAIQNILSGEFLIKNNPESIIEHLLLDSRKLLFPASSLFFSLPGPRRSGNIFIDELYKKGVYNFVVDKNFIFKQNEYAKANIIKVDDVLKALQKLAAYHRRQFNLPVVAITGSNGKTIVKEWLHQLLHDDFNIVRSPKSYNSQIGVPLSVWQIGSQHTLGIFEAGISLPGEMESLEKIIQPAIGIFTNIGEAHNEGFIDTKQKIFEKLQLFKNCNLLIYNADSIGKHVDIENNEQLFNPAIQFFSWSKIANASLVIKDIHQQYLRSTINAIYKNVPIEITIPFIDYAAIENAIACWCYLLYAGFSNTTIASKMQHLGTVEMRLELKEGNNNCSIINDSYSADITSLAIALDFLAQQQQHPKHTIILSDILQSGKSSEDLYKNVATILQQKNISRLIGVGPVISLHQNVFNSILEKKFYSSTADLINDFEALHFSNENILLKGARIFEFEKISHLLELQAHQTVLEINLNAIAHNLQQYQKQLQPQVKVMAMVKAFSYGSGSFEIANLLQFHKVDYLAVAYTDEGVTLRKAGINLPIMVMNAEKSTFGLLIKYNLEPEIFSFSLLDEFKKYLKNINVTDYPIHIKLDTGMHRLGFVHNEVAGLSSNLISDNLVKVKSVFSHLAASDNPALDAFTKEQAGKFNAGCKLLQDKLEYIFLKHIGNTAAIHRHKNLQLDMVRLGIGLYGIDSDNKMQQKLLNASTLKTTIAQIKNVMAGDTIGYSRKGVAVKNAVIATVRIGYADGYPRSLGNGVGYMLVNGKLAPVIGNVCMDMAMLDITGIAAKEGDEVIVFGKELPVTKLAYWANTISYEILAGISQRVKRVYFEE
jgi:alanine racemase